MRDILRLSRFACAAAFTAAFALLSQASQAQVAGGADVNVSKKLDYQNECAIIKNPTNNAHLFAACNNATAGLFAARSTDLGQTWTYPDPADKTIADGANVATQGPAACCDPSLAWDNFGNLFVGYIDSAGANIIVLLSVDEGQTFTTLATFGPASVDQPTVTASAGQVWVVWNQAGQMVARGASVTGLNTVGAFNPILNIPGAANCSFGDIAIAPGGAVVQACESPSATSGPANIVINTKANGLGAGNFAAAVTATATNVGGFHFIPAQNTRSIDAEAGLAFDRNPASPHFGRLYLVYTEEPVSGSNDTQILIRFSDNNGGIWSAPIRADDDATGRSQFLPRIATNPNTGNIGVCWHDARNSASNTAMEEFCTIATPTGAAPTFLANAQIGDALSTGTGSNPPAAGQLDIQFGDYSGLDYNYTPGIGEIGGLHPIWADTSNSTGDNPDGTNRFDAYTDKVTGGAATNEGDPHIITVNGVHYNFQPAGEFVVLRDYDGMQIQTRQTPVATASSFLGPDPYDGLASCVSINSAVAVRVGTHRVTYEPNISGVPDPSGLQLRVDGVLTSLGPQGINLGPGGRIIKASAPGALEIDFPNGTILHVTPGWWGAQSKWFLNVDVSRTPAVEGIMGAISKGSWLPTLPTGMSVGPMPAALNQRYAVLNQQFANAWRVNDASSLFDYKAGTSTATFTIPSWPPSSPPCALPHEAPAKAIDIHVAQEVCRAVKNKRMNADCLFDVALTGESGFARAYQMSERLQTAATVTTVSDDLGIKPTRKLVVFTATVARATPGARGVPSGAVQFTLDGKPMGRPVALDANGQAHWATADWRAVYHKVGASYIPNKEGQLLASSGVDESHAVGEGERPGTNPR